MDKDRLEYQRKYYQEHREQYLKKFKRYRDDGLTRIRREQKKIEAIRSDNPIPNSTKALEAKLPEALRRDLAFLRVEYLSIHISERPPYDLFLKKKLYEYEEKLNSQHRI